MSDAPATYVYCLVRTAEDPPPPAGAPVGLEGAGPPRLLPAGGSLWMVVADAPLPEYGSERIERGLADLEWVSRRALAHEAVVEHFLERGTVIPMKLFTLFHSDERALADIAGRRAELEAILDAIEGHHEWSVRLRLDRGRAEAVLRERAAGEPAVVSGADFLRRKQEERDAGRRLLEEARAAGEALLEELLPLCADTRRRELPQEEGSMRLVLDAALLVPHGRGGELRALVERRDAVLAAGGLDVSLSGPWPAYNFVGGAR